MPQLSVTGGSTYTISVDANLAGKANIQMDWYGEDGYISSTYGPAITAKAGSWTKIRATLKAPAGATNSHPLETVSNGSGTWQSTAADYEAGGGSNLLLTATVVAAALLTPAFVTAALLTTAWGRQHRGWQFPLGHTAAGLRRVQLHRHARLRQVGRLRWRRLRARS
ncbi:hypothetical protein [Fodinicola feengrottensis]|uniref:hypothetical protein n=1 Tax=Fodinicola feengrottensis TaxID=435914 RepID=UPI0013D1379A|nr:hypothetical protein [Fodinicola feengrottensis]